MKLRLLLYAGFVLAVYCPKIAADWDDLVFKVKLTDQMTGKVIPNVPCHIYFDSKEKLSIWDRWGYSDTAGFAQVNFPAGTGNDFIKFKLGEGTGYFNADPSQSYDGFLKKFDHKPDTILINDLFNDYAFGSGTPDSLISSYSVVDTESGNVIQNAIVIIRYKHRAVESEIIKTDTLKTNNVGDVRCALYNDILVRAVSVTVSANGYIPKNFVDSLQWPSSRLKAAGTPGRIWDGENDVIAHREIALAKGAQTPKDTLCFTGRITDTSGAKPVSGAAVTVKFGSSAGNFSQILSAVMSDANGRYFVRYWNKDAYEHIFAKIDVNGGAAGYFDTSVTADKQINPANGAGDTLTMDARLRQRPPADTLIITGKVTDSGGAAVPDATVIAGLLCNGKTVVIDTVRSDAKGEYTVKYLNYEKYSIFTAGVSVTGPKGYGAAVSSKSVTIAPNDGKADSVNLEVKLPKIAIPDSLFICGKISDDDKKPLSQAKVTIILATDSAGQNSVTLKSDPTGSDGNYRIALENSHKVKKVYYRLMAEAVSKDTHKKYDQKDSASINPEDGKADSIVTNITLDRIKVDVVTHPSLTPAQPVTLKIYHLNGRLLKTVQTNSARVAGESSRRTAALGAQPLIIETKSGETATPKRRTNIAK